MSSTGQDSDQKIGAKPAKIGPYQVIRELGQGGMARVFEGRHTELGNRVALKVMQPALAEHAQNAARFLREAKAAAQIRHQHVVDVFDVGVQDGVPYIVMEFLEGADLATLLAQRGPIPLLGIVHVFLPLISAVLTAHRAGIIHRDLKPANLMITKRRPRGAHAMVLDFGISKILDDELERSLTRPESIVGTVQYMAPELTRGAKFASAASDQYAIGVMLYECATGTRPFGGGSSYEIMHAIVTEPVTPPSQLVPALSPQFDALVLRAMDKDPGRRFPSIHALGNALLSFGDKEAWVLWEREFISASATERDLWARDPPTFEGDSMMSTYREASDPKPASLGKWLRWSVVPLTLYAAVTTSLLYRQGLRRQIATAASITPPAPPAPVARDTIAPEGPPEPGSHPLATSPSEAAIDRATSDARRPTRSKTGSAASAKPIAPQGSAPRPSLVFGANQAPIVD